jgi:hypothetical protein
VAGLTITALPQKKKGLDMLQLRRIIVSGLVALLMAGLLNANDTTQNSEQDTQLETDQFIGAYVGSWTTTPLGKECVNTLEWKCIRFMADFSVPW